MRYQGMVYRPPSEAYSLIVQVTYGCSHNTCAFCSMYKEKRFALRPLEEVLEDFQMARQRLPPGGAGLPGGRRRPGAEGGRSCTPILDTDPGAVSGVPAGHQLRLSHQHPHPDGGGAADPPGQGPDHGVYGAGVRLRRGAEPHAQGPHRGGHRGDGPEGPQTTAWPCPSRPSQAWAARSCWSATPSRRRRPSTP